MKKRIKDYLISMTLFVAFIGVFACSSDKDKVEEEKPVIKTLTVNTSKIDFLSTGNDVNVKITTDATTWTSSSDADWIQLNLVTGTKGTTTVKITALKNPTSTTR
ncbi:MAG: BACON domain-containing carbohydrate-binding protein, partial [Flavobacterium sp.]